MGAIFLGMARQECVELTSGNYFIKKRHIWHVSALRLLREHACARYARQSVPPRIDGVNIVFPDTEVSLGFQISVRSRCLEGRDLFLMLYQQEMRGVALDMGIIALKAMHMADVTSAPFALFSTVYRFVRGPSVALGAMFGSPLLSRNQRGELNRLVLGSVMDRGGRKILVHGDLHASHLIVNLAEESLGFIDLEAMRIGKAATNFAQLWIGFHFADPLLGQAFYRRYREQFADVLDEQFDTDVRTELAFRSHSGVYSGRRLRNRDLEGKSRILLAKVLSGATFEEICLRGGHGRTESVY